VLLTASRGGFASLLVASLFLLFTAYLTTRPAPLPAAILAALLVATGWTLLTLGGEPVLERLLATEEIDTGRLQIYALALEMIRDRPWLGQGYGGFEAIFMLYRDPRFELIFDRAHNTYLEHAVELGLPATVLLYAAMALLFGYLLAGVFRRRRNRIFPLVAASSTVLVGFHALVDFSVQIPAVAVTYAAIVGLGLARATPSRRRKRVSREDSRNEGDRPTSRPPPNDDEAPSPDPHVSGTSISMISASSRNPSSFRGRSLPGGDGAGSVEDGAAGGRDRAAARRMRRRFSSRSQRRSSSPCMRLATLSASSKACASPASAASRRSM
ncbi:MAG TPA: O-antigen ligase family protein, partial [Rhodospirillales bacterium]|nr:O-antigen ligase family protein [Rhodospirillales bacterium]